MSTNDSKIITSGDKIENWKIRASYDTIYVIFKFPPIQLGTLKMI